MPDPSEYVKSLFVQALALDPGGRDALLAPLSPGVRTEVEGLLAAHDRAGDFLGGSPEVPPDTEAWADSSAPPAGAQAESPGRLLAGRYKLLEPVGEGGMGAVWMARQTEPVRRLVAVKVLKAGMDGGQVLARFEAERQALALMDHPNIAKVLDAGADECGRPFFVMELVKGTPITHFCDERRLTPRQRLELFVPVCRAVQHAHQKGIIHRDIKPTNVLVALYDDEPVPKVIDFGIAKATGEPLTDKTLHTGLAAVVGTPAYMAPEQATLNNLDVDTRADIYGLGALLYELLAGSPPFSGAELRQAGLLEMLRVIREDEPPCPSTRVSTAAGKPGIAAARGTEPGALAGLLRSDLDWVVMKALDKDRQRRYETAAGFAADIDRFLAGGAVNAAPPSSLYRLRKFVRRNRISAAAAGAVFLAFVLGIAGTTFGMVRASRAFKDEARQREIADAGRKEAVELRNAAVEERRRAEDYGRKAREAVDRFAAIGVDDIGSGPQGDAVRNRILKEAVEFYNEFLGDAAGDPRLSSELDHRRRGIGELVGELTSLLRSRQLFLLMVPQVWDELDLGHKERLLLSARSGVFDPKHGTRPSKEIVLARARRHEEILATLSGARRTRFEQLATQYDLSSALRDPQVQRRLRLSQEQGTAIAGLSESAERALRNGHRGPGRSPDGSLDKWGKTNGDRVDSLRFETLRQVQDLLSADQLRIWEELIGTPFGFGQANPSYDLPENGPVGGSSYFGPPGRPHDGPEIGPDPNSE